MGTGGRGGREARVREIYLLVVVCVCKGQVLVRAEVVADLHVNPALGGKSHGEGLSKILIIWFATSSFNCRG